MKKKRLLALLLALTLIVTGIPLAVYAEDEAQPETTAPAEVNVESSSEQPVEQPAQPSQEQNPGDAADPAVNAAPSEEPASEQPAQTESTDPSSEEPETALNPEAENNKVVTLGENLNENQRASMYAYFGTSADQVKTIVVTHADEVKYMEGIATAQQIGSTTNSCAYVEPTDSGGIKVKTANLNFVTSAMIASTLTTAGMENCNVIAACPFEVSGTGALTGIIMAYETASGQNLDEGQKEAAMQELITTGDLADNIGQEQATGLINDVKTQVLDEGITDPAEIQSTVEEIAKDHDITLTDEQKEQISELMEKISQFDYDLSSLKDTLNNLEGKLSGLSGIWNSIKSFFVGTGNGILSDTDDSALGDSVITDSTVDDGGFKDGLWTRIKNLFSRSDDEDSE